jgi:D-alanyl-lipoteichoic acid acyltransferase DltB (MBOAT superfamily)
VLGAYAFAWQIYGDFSGYSNIARGSAQLLGFHFMVNFRQPYLAASLQEFWHRWHISLSTWLRDYLYISLGGNRHGQLRTYRNLLLTMTIGGFWHGANWTFVVWGMIQGVVLCLERLSKSFLVIQASRSAREISLHTYSFWTTKWLRQVAIFHLVCVGWVFFRSNSIHDAYEFIYYGATSLQWIPEYATAFTFLAMFTLPLFIIDIINERREEEYLLEGSHPYLRVAVAVSLVCVTFLFAGSKPNAFIYFQF